VLVEALPYIKEFRGSTAVVKIGGASLEDLELRRRFVQDVILLSWVGIRVVVVHGGGKQVSAMLDRLGLEPRFSGGLRVTDAPSLEIVEMVLSGQINKELVRLFQELGSKAVGITGKDGGLAHAKKSVAQPDLGLVGEVTEVDTRVIDALSPEFIPVIAPLAIGENGETLNCNADPFAAALAVKLKAAKLVLLTDVAGVLDKKGQLLPSLTAREAQALIGERVISDGMIPKVTNALEAVRGGVRKVHIIDGRQEHALLLEVFTQSGVGTQVVGEGA
jgi:acetylglutamate kinase